MKNAFDGLISRLDTAKDRISELEDMSVKISQIEIQDKKNEKMEQNTQELWSNFKRCNIHNLEY